MLGEALRHRFRFASSTPARAPAPPAFRHRAMHDWERRLHMGLRVTWPCEEALEFQALCPSVLGRVRALDTEAQTPNLDLGRAIWCLMRHLKPRTVIEIGVGLGINARFVLEALAMNRAGHLYSIDPPSLAARKIGLAVEPRLAHRWSLVSDTTKRAMPGLLSRLGQCDLVVHDNPQPGNDMRNEIHLAWAALKPGGVLVMNRIDRNGALQYFLQNQKSGYQVLVADFGVEDFGREPEGQFAMVFKDWR